MNKFLIIIIVLLSIVLSILLYGCGKKVEKYTDLDTTKALYTAIIEMPNGEITEVDAWTYSTTGHGRIMIIYTTDGNKIRVSNCKVAIIDK